MDAIKIIVRRKVLTAREVQEILKVGNKTNKKRVGLKEAASHGNSQKSHCKSHCKIVLYK